MPDQIQQMLNMVKNAQKKLEAEVAGVSDAMFFAAPKQGEWAISEILGHTMELQWFWMSKIKTMLAQDNPKMVRSEGESAGRAGFVATYKGYPRGITMRVLGHANQDILDDIAKLPKDKLQRTGTRGDGKVVNISQQVEIIAKHVEEHANQIRENKRLLTNK